FFFLSSLATSTPAGGAGTTRWQPLSPPAQAPPGRWPPTSAALRVRAPDRSRRGSPRRSRPSGATPAPARSAPRGGGRRGGYRKARWSASEAPPSVRLQRARRPRAQDQRASRRGRTRLVLATARASPRIDPLSAAAL